MSKYRVRSHKWNSETLEVFDQWFEDLESAMSFANDADSHRVKVYNPEGNLVHSGIPAPKNTYA